MPVKVRCSGCEKVLNAPDKLRGKTVKCPQCQSPIRIPAAQQKKAKAEPDPFADDFLADLDLSQAEDESQRICPRCGAAVSDDDIDCEACGASLLAAGGAVAGKGSSSPVGRKKKKGPNKSLFYQNTWGDAWKFTKKNKSYSIRTSLYMLFLYLFYFCFLFMYNWCINLPPKAFWALLLFVFYMAPIGWVWHFVTETIKASLAKQDRLKRVNFDFFTNVALGIKFFAWQIVCAIPILLPAAIVSGILASSGAIIPAAIVSAISSLLVYSLLPVAMTHMAMPQQLAGWNPLKVFSGWSKSLGAVSYWLLILIITTIPLSATLGAIGATSGNKIIAFQRTMASNSSIYLQRQRAEEDKEFRAPEANPAPLPWNNLTIPGILMGVALLMTGPIVVFNARIVGQIAYYYSPEWNLNTLEKQVKYKSKPQIGEEGFKKVNRQGLPTVATGLNLMLSAIGILTLCIFGMIILAVVAMFTSFVPPMIIPAIIGFVILGCGVLYLVGVLMLFATPPEAKARVFLLLSFLSPMIAIILGGLVAAGVASVAGLQGLAVASVVVYGGISLSGILTFVFFIMFLKRLSEYLYYYAGSEQADTILFLYAAAVALSILGGIIRGASEAYNLDPLGPIFSGILGLIAFGIEIAWLKNLFELLGGLREECRKS